MRQYIKNLTDNLIGKNRYAELAPRIRSRGDFLKHIKRDLESGDVKDMKSETLGKILCSFDIGDVMANKKDLFEGIHFDGDCEEMLRELVALCLAYAIRDRLDETSLPGIPPYRK